MSVDLDALCTCGCMQREHRFGYALGDYAYLGCQVHRDCKQFKPAAAEPSTPDNPEPPARPDDAPNLPTASEPGGANTLPPKWSQPAAEYPIHEAWAAASAATTLIASWRSWLCQVGCGSRYTVEQPCCGKPTERIRVELHREVADA